MGRPILYPSSINAYSNFCNQNWSLVTLVLIIIIIIKNDNDKKTNYTLGAKQRAERLTRGGKQISEYQYENNLMTSQGNKTFKGALTV